METIDNIQLQFLISATISGFINLIILIACIILINKKRTPATILLLAGSIFTLTTHLGGFIYNIWAAQQGAQAVLTAHIVLPFFHAFSFLLFGIGFILLAINDFKKQ